jgi:hypothetical protein
LNPQPLNTLPGYANAPAPPLQAGQTDDALPVYNAEPTGKKFHADDSFVRCIMGPVGSGKSSICTIELLHRAMRQAPGRDGIRHTRFAVVRNTYPELKSTTIRTVTDWLPEKVFQAKVNYSMPHTYRLRFNDVALEIVFLALDRDEDIGKLKSLELTGLWFNEATEISMEVIRMGLRRVMRYPAMKDGGPSWSGVWMDYNPPDTDHPLYKVFEEEHRKDWRLYKQPAALLPDPAGTIQSAEGTRYRINMDGDNVRHHKPEYYEKANQGEPDAWIKVYAMGQYGMIQDGAPVYPNYDDAYHYVDRPLQPHATIPLMVGMDFGLNPTAVITQFTPAGQLRVLRELINPDRIGLTRFINDILKPHLAAYYAGYSLVMWGDPAGKRRVETDERTCFEMLEEAGYNVQPAPTNNFLPRQKAVDDLLLLRVPGEGPKLLIGQGCNLLHSGFLGKYRFDRVAVKGREGQFRDEPIKSMHSHPHDALQYVVMGVMGGSIEPPKINEAIADYNAGIGPASEWGY